MSDATAHRPVDFPVPKFNGLDAAFGARRKDYLTAEQMGREFYSSRHPMCRVASSLFFDGGKLADHGIQFKPGIDRSAAMRAIQALLCSFDPPHEIKIGTMGYALNQWCEPIPPTTKPKR